MALMLTPELRAAQWASLGPDGGDINVIAVDPQTPTTLYVGTANSSIFKSTDGASSWSRSVGSAVGATGIAIDPLSPSTVYAVNGSNVLYRSLDAGGMWTLVGLPSSAGAVALSAANPSVLFATMGDGLRRSTDGGATWSDPLLANVGPIAVDPGNANVIYARVPNEIYKSIDGGDTWSALGSDNIGAVQIAVDPSNSNVVYAGDSSGLFKSIDAGATWSPTGLGTGVRRIAFDAGGGGVLYAATQGASVRKSVDGAASWSAASTGLPTPSGFPGTLATHPSSPGIVYVAFQGFDRGRSGLFRSSDGAATWTFGSVGIRGVYLTRLAPDPSTSGTLFATSPEGLFRTTDAGASWDLVLDGDGTNFSLYPSSVSAAAVNPADPLGVLAATWLTVVRSTDGGATWVLPIPYDQLEYVTSLAFDPVTPSIVYASTSTTGVHRSVDGAASWDPASQFLPAYVATLVVDPVTPGRLYAGTDQGLYISNSSASSWFPSNTPLGAVPALAIDPVTPSTLYAGGYFGVIFTSADSGLNWAVVGSAAFGGSSLSALTIGPGGAGLFAAGGWGVSQSVNGGAQWQVVNGGLPSSPLVPSIPSPGIHEVVADPVSTTRLYAAGPDGAYALELTADCGDGIVVAPEQCDDGNLATCDGCSPTCTTEIGSTCGDGIVFPGCEECDDGNTGAFDGCSAGCTVEACYDCAGEPSMCTPFSVCTSGDGCCPANCYFGTDTDCAPGSLYLTKTVLKFRGAGQDGFTVKGRFYLPIGSGFDPSSAQTTTLAIADPGGGPLWSSGPVVPGTPYWSRSDPARGIFMYVDPDASAVPGLLKVRIKELSPPSGSYTFLVKGKLATLQQGAPTVGGHRISVDFSYPFYQSGTAAICRRRPTVERCE